MCGAILCALKHMEFAQENFWTAHFGGVYIFQSSGRQAAITSAPKEPLGDLPITRTYHMSERNRIAQFLEDNGTGRADCEGAGRGCLGYSAPKDGFHPD